ncbi:MAG: thiosulfate oxidation carrier protein SoxY, partial [Hyphomicrobiales bacterium]
MELTRRKALMLGVGVTTLAFMPFTPASAAVEDAIAEFTGGADAGDGDITLITPEIAENGNTVPVSVDAPGAVSIAIFAAGNPNPDVVTFNFGP